MKIRKMVLNSPSILKLYGIEHNFWNEVLRNSTFASKWDFFGMFTEDMFDGVHYVSISQKL